MNDAWLRINRAKSGVERLHAEITAWGAEHPDAYRTTAQYDSKGNVSLFARVTEQPPPDKWGLLIGDVVVDLRSALDYAVYSLARSHTKKDPPPYANRLEFPIALSESWFKSKGLTKLIGLKSAAVDYITSIQPYQPGNGVNSNALHVLNELVGVNKHRFVLLMWATLKETTLRFDVKGARVENYVGYRVAGPLKDGAKLADFRLVATEPPSHVQIEASITPHIAFEPTSPAFGSEVYDTLCVIGGAVEDVVTHLQAHI
jgi:hypothetical protein